MILPLYSFDDYLKSSKGYSLEDFPSEVEQVRQIIRQVRQRGDQALRELAKHFDDAELEDLAVTEEEFAAAAKAVDPYLVQALKEAGENIERFHRRQLRSSWWEEEQGTKVGQRITPIHRIGAYIPGGTAAYPSSVLMTVIPARVAGVAEIVLCTPPGPGGTVHPLTLTAAREAGATAVFKAGGAQAVAAMAYGTQTIPRVQKIVGPGNIYVTLAKKEVFGTVGIDMLAGPSEIVVVADEEANPVFIAADLLSQAEHDALSRAILITPSRPLAEAVGAEVAKQLSLLPRRETAERSIREQGAVILVRSLQEAWKAANHIAPEHLELHVANPFQHLSSIKNAGAVFVGPYAPEPLGDYWAGSNHVLPTGGAARYASSLGTGDFLKATSVIYYTKEALLQAAPRVEALAGAEGLDAHLRAIAVRRGKNSEDRES